MQKWLFALHAYIISQIFEFFTCFFKKTEKISKSPKAFKDPENIMKKDEFLKLLQARLVERGLTQAAAEKETEHVRIYLAESSMDDVDISIDEMAEGILSMLSDSSENNHEDIDISPVPMVSDDNDESVSDELSAAIAAIDSPEPAKEPTKAIDEEEEKPETVAIPIVIEPEAEAQNEPAEDVAANEETPAQAEPMPAEDIPEPPAAVRESALEESHPEKLKEAPSDELKSDEENEDIEKYIPYNQKVRMKKIENSKKGGNEWLYVLLLVITIPIAVALILTAAVLYLGFWVVLALAMIVCIAVLVVFVAVFALISIVGIVYGVVELITGNVPVGLFEIGLGVMVGAAVMFIGILVYNFAVRFIPFIMKLLARLFRAGFRAIRNGYQVLKGAVEEL